MAMRKMTFTIPEELALMLTRRVAPSSRSRYVSEAIQASLRQRDEMIKAACLAANDDPETRQIQADFDALPDMVIESWDDASAAR
jgi:metal-responsive CopG/Arc/MetJ family transcriptional regulator